MIFCSVFGFPGFYLVSFASLRIASIRSASLICCDLCRLAWLCFGFDRLGRFAGNRLDLFASLWFASVCSDLLPFAAIRSDLLGICVFAWFVSICFGSLRCVSMCLRRGDLQRFAPFRRICLDFLDSPGYASVRPGLHSFACLAGVCSGFCRFAWVCLVLP